MDLLCPETMSSLQNAKLKMKRKEKNIKVNGFRLSIGFAVMGKIVFYSQNICSCL
jgi:hypothetical protein